MTKGRKTGVGKEKGKNAGSGLVLKKNHGQSGGRRKKRIIKKGESAALPDGPEATHKRGGGMVPPKRRDRSFEVVSLERMKGG